MWNRISDAVLDRKNAVVLYLPGSQDLDAPEAIRRGFHPANLIAIERNKEIAEQLRSRKRTVICADLSDVLVNWPATTPVAVVLADLQSNLTDPTKTIMNDWLANVPFANGVLILNIQRGRESPSDPTWQFLREPVRHYKRALSHWRTNDPDRWGHIDDRNRAYMMMAGLLNLVTCSWLRLEGYGNEVPLDQIPADVRERSVLAAHASFGISILPSYRSSPRSPLFDSLMVKDKGQKRRYEPPPEYRDKVTRQRIAAALALRTMRREGKLAYA